MKNLIAATATAAVFAAAVVAPTQAEGRTKDIVKYGAIGLGALALSNAVQSQGYYGGYNSGYYPASSYGYSQPSYGYYSQPSYGYSYPSQSYSYGYSYPSYGGSYYGNSYNGGYYY